MSEPVSHRADPADFFGALPILKLRFTITVENRASLPEFLGSAWRGLIGWELQRLICPFPQKRPCPQCVIKAQCPYFLVIEEQAPPEGLADAPRGYVLYPWDDCSGATPGAVAPEQMKLDLTLFGDAAKYLPVLVMALLNGRKSGLGVQQTPYQLESAVEVSPDGTESPVPLMAERPLAIQGPFPLTAWIEQGICRVTGRARLTTPVRLRKKGQYLAHIDWPFFFSTLARRLEGLNTLYHQGAPLGKENWRYLQAQFAASTQLPDELQWDDKARYSNRQHRKVPMGGLAGEISLTHSPTWLKPWWIAASLAHVGKGAAMGWGKVDFLHHHH